MVELGTPTTNHPLAPSPVPNTAPFDEASLPDTWQHLTTEPSVSNKLQTLNTTHIEPRKGLLHNFSRSEADDPDNGDYLTKMPVKMGKMSVAAVAQQVMQQARKPFSNTSSTFILPQNDTGSDGISDDDTKALTPPPTRGLSIDREAAVDDIKEDLSVSDESEPKAITELRQKALKGDADACYRLARHYRTGDGVSSSDAWAVYWYQQTVTFDEDHIEAWFNWGYMCEKGYGTPQNSQQAYVCWFKAANLDVTLALDDDEVRTCASANTSLGYLYQLGRGIDQNTDLATKCFLKAVRLGNIRAYYNLGALCPPSDHTGLVVTQKALYYHYACEHGHIGSLYKIGKLYRHGSDGLIQSDAMAAHYWQIAADCGHIGALYEIGRMHSHGSGGLELSHERAVGCWHKSADLGHAPSQNGLGFLHEMGWGFDQANLDQAGDYYHQAADQGYILSMLNLWFLHRHDGLQALSTSSNDQAAADWMQRALQQNAHQVYHVLVDWCENKDSDDYRARAYLAARTLIEWKPDHPRAQHMLFKLYRKG